MEVDTLSFGLPCQNYRIRYEAIVGERLPAPYDFALRLLRMAEPMRMEDFQAFFGWNATELSVLLSFLSDSELVAERSGRLSLGRAAVRAFTGTDDEHDTPMLSSPSLQVETVAFDKVSFNLLDPTLGKVHPAAALPLLSIRERERAANGAQAARSAFERNFTEFWHGRPQFNPELPLPKQPSVIEVEPKAIFRRELTIPVRLGGGPASWVDLDFADLERTGRQRSRDELITAVRREVGDDPSPGDEHLALRCLEATGLPFAKHLSRYRPSQWARLTLSQPRIEDAQMPTVLLCGSAISPQVRQQLMEAAVEREGEVALPDAPLLWLRPSMPLWGVGSAFAHLGADLARRAAHSVDGAILLCRAREERLGPEAVQRKARHTFDAVISLTGGSLPGALEIVLRPKIWALVLVHRPEEAKGLPVGTGMWTGAPGLVTSVERVLLDCLKGAKGHWTRRQRASRSDPIRLLRGLLA
ncbi:hypothetical protein EAH89_15710 [Roseomonas nepalensis]|uniref:Uncharacterized protein n=1 Tax=Muricoccus nepalensis TaxID=1854500 RepID=A0A502FWJ4_9PROT|nr:hypothetical protein EAH89_15710 [Roseomonas nepalensis]